VGGEEAERVESERKLAEAGRKGMCHKPAGWCVHDGATNDPARCGGMPSPNPNLTLTLTLALALTLSLTLTLSLSLTLTLTLTPTRWPRSP
jgi:hypothetical protein